jgi:NADH:ubiquinone oxidoreductase subunit 5 (subunit L)/multisubunit Na+/H+ antiporter MnhA subunit
MPLPALLLILAALLPLAGCVTLLILGKRLGTPLAGYVAIFFIAASFACSGWAMMQWVLGGNYGGLPYKESVAPISLVWGGPGGGVWQFGIYIDTLTVTLFVMVTVAALLVHIFVTRSMRRELRFARFFTILSLSCFSVLALVLCASLLYAVVFLELACFCASLLVGFRFDREGPARAALRMFVVNRVGDLALLLGLGILFSYVGALTWPDLWLTLGDGAWGGAVMVAGNTVFPAAALTLAGSALFVGISARLAQFPLHVWAADAAEGVAPAAGMAMTLILGVAGVYLVARLFPILTPSARLLVAIIGATTMTMAALIACVQQGIKQVLTWLAASQLGFIVLAMGVGSWIGATYHLETYCLFQLLLFLSAGAVIRAARGRTELAEYGGLVRRMPATAITSAIAILAACGAGSAGIGISGYYSRHLVLNDAAMFSSVALDAGRSRAYGLLFILPLVATLLTAFAMTRWWMLTFAGRPRNRRLFDHAREAPTLLWPTIILAVLTSLAGKWFGVADALESSIAEARNLPAEVSHAGPSASAHLFDAAWMTDDDDIAPDSDATTAPAGNLVRARSERLAGRWQAIMLALGVLMGAAMYLRGPHVARRLVRITPVSWFFAWLIHRMYFDELYDAIFVTLTVGLADLATWVDQNVVAPLARLLLRV